MKKLMQLHENERDNTDMTQMLFEFKNNTLMNFIEKIYFPIQDYQNHQLELEKKRAD